MLAKCLQILLLYIKKLIGIGNETSHSLVRWDEATGGYIVATKAGKVLVYHIYNRNYFLKNIKYETASTSRYSFGEVYSENGEDFINLNLQVRFR